MKTPKQKIVVIYHGDCRDGFGGAWAAWKKFGKKAAYIPARDRFVTPCELKDKEIYLIDYTYGSDVVKELIKKNKRVTAIDHHITSESAARMTEKYSFDLHHSGAVLAWKYFHPGKKVPTLLHCVEDHDMWRWKTPSSREVLAVVNLLGQGFAKWNQIARDLEVAAKRMIYIERGKFILRYEKYLRSELLQSVELVNFLGYKIFAINAPRHFADELGRILAEKSHSFSVVWHEYAGKIRVSLRSDGSVDVSKIAQKFNGGGHKAASGFSFDVGKKFPWKLIKLT